MPIDATEFGAITVDWKFYDHDVIIRLSGKVEKRRKRLSKAQYAPRTLFRSLKRSSCLKKVATS